MRHPTAVLHPLYGLAFAVVIARLLGGLPDIIIETHVSGLWTIPRTLCN